MKSQAVTMPARKVPLAFGDSQSLYVDAQWATSPQRLMQFPTNLSRLSWGLLGEGPLWAG